MKSVLLKAMRSLAILLAAILLTFYFWVVLPFWGIPFSLCHHSRPPITPPWALECWLWEDDVNTAEKVDELLSGYAEHDIPVRTILIDSPWSTRYNDFCVDTIRYPHPEQWLRKLQDQGYRVVLWMTCMVDSLNKDTRFRESGEWYDLAKKNNYLVGNGYQISWWKGRGGFIDYTHPQALKWWRGMQQQLFDWGIDGWKLDGTATFFSSRLGKVLFPYQTTFKGILTTRQYMNLYYREEYRHGLSQNPEFITMARSIDRLYAHPEGFAPLDAAPVCWVGDQKHTWKSTSADGFEEPVPGTDLVMEGIGGLETAMEYILASAERGYCVIGSDIAGFSGKVIPPRLYVRWAQFSAFCGLFMNGGHGDRRLWNRSSEELEIIRKFSWLHTELIPYIFSHVVECHRGGKPLQRPLAGKYHYLFGDDLLVAPIYEDSYRRLVRLPRGTWRYFFDDRQVFQGPSKFIREYPLDEYPVFVRNGAIIPLDVKRHYTGWGDATSANYLTLLIYPNGKSRFTQHHPDARGEMEIRAEQSSDRLSISLSGKTVPHILRIHSDQKPVAISCNAVPLSASHWRYDNAKCKILIRNASQGDQNYLIRY